MSGESKFDKPASKAWLFVDAFVGLAMIGVWAAAMLALWDVMHK